MWGSEDTVGLLSLIIGSTLIYLFPAITTNIMRRRYGLQMLLNPNIGMDFIALIFLISSIPILSMGLIALLQGSKLGIGGSLCGAYLIISGIFGFLL